MNALKELEDLKIDWDNIRALRINYYDKTVFYNGESCRLNEVKKQLSQIDYSNGYGCQNLFGLILMKDGSWYERGEYDGSEWWNYKHTPAVNDVINYRETCWW